MMRLDKYCAQEMGSRTKAQDRIKEGLVLVNGKVVKKNSFVVQPNDKVVIEKEDEVYVSRAAFKLKAAIDTFSIDLEKQIVLDIGASTGGFTEVCLRSGASKVYALDVGHLQLAPSLDADDRVVKMEGRNARHLESSWFDDSIDFICMDVSFISAKTILERVFSQLDIQALVVLIKPQFECGPEYLNKQGVLKNKKLALQIVSRYETYLRQLFRDVRVLESPIQGRHGNQEYVLYARK